MSTGTAERVEGMSKPKAPGNINPCGWATIFEGKRAVARCMDTPNAMALAFSKHPDATHAIAHYPGWADKRTERADCKGWANPAASHGYAALCPKPDPEDWGEPDGSSSDYAD